MNKYLFRYSLILFSVATLLVVLSYIFQIQNNNQQAAELASNTSQLDLLRQENHELRQQINSLREEIERLKDHA